MNISNFDRRLMSEDVGGGQDESELEKLKKKLLELEAKIVENKAAKEQMTSLAENIGSRGDMSGDSYRDKSAEIFDTLKAYGNEQTARYEELIDMIKSGDYKSTPAAKSIIASYLAAADEAFGDAIASGGADNGGNIDSYSAANANRQKLAYISEGEAAALDYFGEQADKLLKVISALGADSDDFFGRMQNSADADADFAESLYSLAGDLYTELSDRELAEQEIDGDTLSKLFDTYTNVYEPDADMGHTMSPMELEREFNTIAGDGATAEEKYKALITLWKKYPDMQDYISDMYEAIKKEENTYKFTDLK